MHNVCLLSLYFIAYLGDFDYELCRKAAPPSGNRCKKDEVSFTKACYFLTKNGNKIALQEDARSKCHNRDADLASLSDISKHILQKNHLASKGYWIGLG